VVEVGVDFVIDTSGEEAVVADTEPEAPSDPALEGA